MTSYSKIEHFEKEYADTHHDTALNVTEGVADQPIVNPHFVRKRRRTFSTDEYVEGILRGDITILSQAITLIESNKPEHYDQAQQIIERCLPHAGRSVRIGITGVPGAGKSTFIEAVGNMVVSLHHRLAVLAIDPSSERSGGSILGDKTRMESISSNPDIFIRPSPSAGSLGGVARKTRETIVLCEAAGFDVIFIETVGVGQSETAVHSMVDMFMMLQISGAGDELQGIKKGVIELADAILVNKCDGNMVERSNLKRAELAGVLHYLNSPTPGWTPFCDVCSAYTGKGIREAWERIDGFRVMMEKSGFFARRRASQKIEWFKALMEDEILRRFYHIPGVKDMISHYTKLISNGAITAASAVKNLLDSATK